MAKKTTEMVFGTKIGEGCDAVNPNDLLELMARAEYSPGHEAHDEEENPQPESAQNAERKPIVSIHGKDVDESELEKADDKPNKNAA